MLHPIVSTRIPWKARGPATVLLLRRKRSLEHRFMRNTHQPMCRRRQSVSVPRPHQRQPGLCTHKNEIGVHQRRTTRSNRLWPRLMATCLIRQRGRRDRRAERRPFPPLLGLRTRKQRATVETAAPVAGCIRTSGSEADLRRCRQMLMLAMRQHPAEVWTWVRLWLTLRTLAIVGTVLARRPARRYFSLTAHPT